MTSYRYDLAEDVLTPDLVQECKKALDWRFAIISFRKNGELSTSEAKLGSQKLVQKVRDGIQPDSKRCLYFSGERSRVKPPDTRKQHAKILIDAGFSAQAVADTVGAHRETIASWWKSKRQGGIQGHMGLKFNYHKYRAGAYHMAGLNDIEWEHRDTRGWASEDMDAVDQLREKLGISAASFRYRALAVGYAVEYLEEYLKEDT